MINSRAVLVVCAMVGAMAAMEVSSEPASSLGMEVGAPFRLSDGDEYRLAPAALVAHGEDLFTAIWTEQEGGGRPLSKGTGVPLSDIGNILTFPRNFNRVSAPDANACVGCHAQPFGAAGGEGDIVANVFVLGQRFDFATFDSDDMVPTRGSFDERGIPVTLQSIANSRATTGMFGAGYIEMMARQITRELIAIRDQIAPGESASLTAKGIGFGVLSRAANGRWDTSSVQGLSPASLISTAAHDPPSLIIRPWHQASAVVSLREFTNNAMNHHHGIQASERFGDGADPDGDGFVDELSRADVTAISVFQAAMAVPGQVLPRNHRVRTAIYEGERHFRQVGCAECHIPALPLTDEGHLFIEPNPFNPPGNLQPRDNTDLVIDLNDATLPLPRLAADRRGVTWVPAYTDFKLHDITSGPDDPNREALNMHFPAGSIEFNAGNTRFLTKRLWGVGNTAPYFHHGRYTTMRAAILAHAGEASEAREAFQALTDDERDTVIAFLKSLQVLPPGTPWTVLDEKRHSIQRRPEETKRKAYARCRLSDHSC